MPARALRNSSVREALIREAAELFRFKDRLIGAFSVGNKQRVVRSRCHAGEVSKTCGDRVGAFECCVFEAENVNAALASRRQTTS